MERFFILLLWVFQPLVAQEQATPVEKGKKDSAPEPDGSDLVMDALYAADQSFSKAQKKIRDDYRKEYQKIIKLAETVEIYLLDFEMIRQLPKGELEPSNSLVEGSQLDAEEHEILEEEVSEKPPGFMRIGPCFTFSKILKRKVLEAKAVKQGEEAVSDLLGRPDKDTSAWCHYPIHGIRMATKKGEILFQTSVCYACGNYFFRYPEYRGEADWIDFSSEKLEAFLKKEMPIPQAELDRFEAKYGSKEKEQK